MTTPRPKPTDRELARSAFGVSIFVGVLMLWFGGCGAVKLHRETATPRDVTVADLGDTTKVPSDTRVRVQAELRPGSRKTTSRKRTLVALVDAPSVVVLCATNEPLCADGPARRSLVGFVSNEAGDYAGVVRDFIPKVLKVDPAKVRLLYIDGGEDGFGGEYIASFVIAGIFALVFVMGMARGLFMLRRAKRTAA